MMATPASKSVVYLVALSPLSVNVLLETGSVYRLLQITLFLGLSYQINQGSHFFILVALCCIAVLLYPCISAILYALLLAGSLKFEYQDISAAAAFLYLFKVVVWREFIFYDIAAMVICVLQLLSAKSNSVLWLGFLISSMTELDTEIRLYTTSMIVLPILADCFVESFIENTTLMLFWQEVIACFVSDRKRMDIDTLYIGWQRAVILLKANQLKTAVVAWAMIALATGIIVDLKLSAHTGMQSDPLTRTIFLFRKYRDQSTMPELKLVENAITSIGNTNIWLPPFKSSYCFWKAEILYDSGLKNLTVPCLHCAMLHVASFEKCLSGQLAVASVDSLQQDVAKTQKLVRDSTYNLGFIDQAVSQVQKTTLKVKLVRSMLKDIVHACGSIHADRKTMLLSSAVLSSMGYEEFGNVCSKDPGTWKTQVALLERLDLTEQLVELLVHMSSLIIDDPTELLLLGEKLFAYNKLDVAIKVLVTAGAIAPNSSAILYQHAIVAAAQLQYYESSTMLKAVIQQTKDDPLLSTKANAELCHLLYVQDLNIQAIECLNDCIGKLKDLSTPQMFNIRGICKAKMNLDVAAFLDFSLARDQALLFAKTKSPLYEATALADSYNNLGSCYWSQGLLQKALSAYREAIKVDPTHTKSKENFRHLELMTSPMSDN